jgi:hypothetical protein
VRDLVGGDFPREVDDSGPFRFVFGDLVPVDFGDDEAAGFAVVEPAPQVQRLVLSGFERQGNRPSKDLVGVGGVAQLHRDHALRVATGSPCGDLSSLGAGR